MKKITASLILAAVLLGCSMVFFQPAPSSAADNITITQSMAVPAPPSGPADNTTGPGQPYHKPHSTTTLFQPYAYSSSASATPWYSSYASTTHWYNDGAIWRWPIWVSQYGITPAQPSAGLVYVINDNAVYTRPVSYIEQEPVISQFAADLSYIQQGQAATLTWAVSDVAGRTLDVTIFPNIGSVASSGSVSIVPDQTTTYTLTASNVDGSVSAATTVTVEPDMAAPVVYTIDAGSAGAASSSRSTADYSSWLPYLLLFGLLAVAAVVAIALIARRPQPVYAAAASAGSATRMENPARTEPATLAATSSAQTAIVTGARLEADGGKAIAVSGRPQMLGRNDFQSLAPELAAMISRQHLRVESRDGGYFIEDNDSTNGTRLNGERITGKGRQSLKNNDLIDIGGVLKLTFRS